MTKRFGSKAAVSEEDIQFEAYDDVKPSLQLIRMILIVLLVIVLVGTLAVFAVGVMTHEVDYGSKQVSDLIGVAMYQIDSIMMIVAGAASFLITILGLVAVLIKHRCLLGLHLVLLAFVSVMLFVGGVLGYIFIAELEDTVEQSFEKIIKTNFGVNIATNSENKEITDAWNTVQQKFQCCGAYGNENSTTSWAIYKLHSTWYQKGFSNGSMVPRSCCGSGDIVACMGSPNQNLTGPPYVNPPVTSKNPNYTIYTDGCYDQLHSYLVQNGILIGTVAIVVAVFMIVEMGFSIFLHRKMKTFTF